MRRAGRWGGVSHESCFYGGAFPHFSGPRGDTEGSGDFLPKQYVCVMEMDTEVPGLCL